MTLNVPETPAPTVPPEHGVPGNPVQVQPAGGVTETNVKSAAGVAVSLKVAPVTADVPVFVTTCVYVMSFPACTGTGDPTFVTDRFAPVAPTSVLTEAVLFAEFGSSADEPTDTVSPIVVPFAVPAVTFATSVNVPELTAAILAFEQTTLPVAPAFVFRQLHPAGAEKDTSVVLAGIVATTVALSAALGPLFVTTCV